MKRFLKIVGIFALFATALSYFAFRLTFFDPFEGAYASLDRLVPRDVDFMVRRKSLRDDFYRFPYPEFFESLRLQSEWKDFAKTPLFQEKEQALDVGGQMRELETQLEQLRPLDALTDFLGEEVMVAGRTTEGGELHVAALMRVSFRVKAIVEGMRFGFLRDLAGDQIQSFEENDGLRSLTVATGETFHLFRLQDVVVAGNDRALVEEMLALGKERGGVGLVDSPQYTSVARETSETGRSLDFAVQLGEFSQRGGFGEFRAEEYDPPLWKWTARTIRLEEFGMAVGRLFLGDEMELSLRVSADLISLKPRSAGLYSGSSGNLEDLYQFCGRVFPEKVFSCGYFRLEVGPFFLRLAECLDKDSRELLDDFLARNQRSGSQFPIASAADFVRQLGDCFANEIAVAFEPQAPYHIPGTAEGEMKFPQDSWGPRFAAMMPLSNTSSAQFLIDSVVNRLKSPRESIAKVYTWGYEGTDYTFQEVEFADAEFPSVSYGFFEIEGRPFLVVTTTGEFLNEIVSVLIQAERGYEGGLSTQKRYQQAAGTVKGFGQGFLYLASEGTKKSLEDLTEWFASVETKPDWAEVRERVIRELRDKAYPAERGQEMTRERRREFEAATDDEMDRRELVWRSEELPRAVEARQQNLDALDLFRWLTLTMKVNDRDLEIRGRLGSVARF